MALPEISLGFGELAPPVKQQAQGVVAAAVQRVAAQGFFVIRLGRIGGVPVLFQVQAVEEQLLIGRDLGGRLAGVAGAGISGFSSGSGV